MTSDLQTLGRWPWTMMSVKQDGTVVEADVCVGLQAGSKKFVADLPPYVAQDTRLTNATAQGLIDDYEAACEHYWIKTLGKSAVPVLCMVNYAADHGIDLLIKPIYMLGDTQHQRNSDGTIGKIIGPSDKQFTYIPDTPAARAKLEQLQASIKVAADILAGLHTAQDPEQYLLNISSDWQAPADPQPAQAALPFDDNDDI